MKATADYHTHTIYSHGIGTIEENVKEAISKGLKIVGISDHGYRHMTYGVKYDDIFKMKAEIDKLKEKYTQIDILMGIEANVLDDMGNIDVNDNIAKYFDYIMAGYHFGSIPTKFIKGTYNHMCNFIKVLNKNSKEFNTRALINAMKNNNIFAITHPGAKALIDLDEVSNVALKTNTYLEINSKHGHLTVDEIISIKDKGVKFIIGSDAHKPQDVGNLSNGIERAKVAKLSVDSIINVI